MHTDIICFLIPFSLIFLVFFGMYMYCEWVAAADLTPFTLAEVSATDTCSMAAAVSFAAGLQCAAATAGDIKQIYWSHCLDGKSGHDSPFFNNLPPKLTDVSGLCRRLSLTCSLPQHDLKMSTQYVQHQVGISWRKLLKFGKLFAATVDLVASVSHRLCLLLPIQCDKELSPSIF